jgi:hypothetical protein
MAASGGRGGVERRTALVRILGVGFLPIDARAAPDGGDVEERAVDVADQKRFAVAAESDCGDAVGFADRDRPEGNIVLELAVLAHAVDEEIALITDAGDAHRTAALIDRDGIRRDIEAELLAAERKAVVGQKTRGLQPVARRRVTRRFHSGRSFGIWKTIPDPSCSTNAV